MFHFCSLFNLKSTMKLDVSMDDRISYLPWEILDNILSRLPIKTAVSTSILSRQWRDKWIDISKLVFDKYSFKSCITDSGKLARIVNSVLLSHRGPIETFSFTSRSFFRNADMDSWITFLSRCSVKELTCDFSHIYNYALPSCLFSFESLKHLSLTNCWSTVPHTFTAFSGLVSLELKQFADGKTIQAMINNCPSLEKLVISDVCFDDCVYICAPNLNYLYLESKFHSISLEGSPHLVDASFKMNSEAYAVQEKAQLPCWFSQIRRLTLSGYFIRSLAARCIWRGIPIACDKVEFIEIDELHFDQLEEINLALSIVMCSSNLKEVHIKVLGPNHVEFAEGLAHLSCCFDQLRVIKIEISRYDVEDKIKGSFLEIPKLFLSCSPVLEKMHVHYNHSERSDTWFRRGLFKCERATLRQFKLAYTSTHIPYRTPPEENNIFWSLTGLNYGFDH